MDGMLGQGATVAGERTLQLGHASMTHQTTLHGLINSIPDLIYIKNSEGVYIGCNKAFEAYFGKVESEIVGKTDFDFMAEEAAECLRDQEQLILLQHEAQHNEEWVAYPDGRRVCLETVKTPCFDVDGKPSGLIGIGHDITERKVQEEELARQANMDCLTGLSNRRHFMELAEYELARAQRYGSPISLIMLDLDDFKSLNDNNGHYAGDCALQRLGDIFRKSLRGADIVGRLGGEEFAILLPETDDRHAQEVAERLRQSIETAEIEIEGGGTLHFTASLGVDTLFVMEMDVGRLLCGADQALYHAKQTGRNRVCTLSDSMNGECEGDREEYGRM